MRKNLVFMLFVLFMIFVDVKAQYLEENDYLIITFVKYEYENLKFSHKRHDWIVCVDSMQTSNFYIYPFRYNVFCCINSEEDIETLVYKHCKKVQTIKCYSKNGYKEKIHVYVTPIHGKLGKNRNGYYEAISDIVYTPSILKDKKRMKYLYSHYNYVPFTKHEPFKIPDY